MHGVNDRYQLGRSRLAIAFQCVFFCMIILLAYVSLPLIWWIIALVGYLLVWLLFKPNQVEVLELLDDQEWSLKLKNQQKIHRVSLRKIIDHHFYMVIYFQEKNPKSLVIWKDQIDQIQWKRLLARAKLN
ncbi:hypothetical protein [Acinetobacter shaoyimingii]|uniref:Uncharacterized protein n=1 Tax=Acinetobacter shaoyimingii TaxID=2715164 RepID=A0A6G8RZ00_9GAMM|nr:hypothetical protein [Acinetobacter shaoyimingii]NHB58003.1 hypothetical protein [Acinetobacter shaoyimingii]QIO06963.1 hypothetical protein G8E00_13965 [Acinetobacter shaoyimingii]